MVVKHVSSLLEVYWNKKLIVMYLCSCVDLS